jgi:hypothetical protein
MEAALLVPGACSNLGAATVIAATGFGVHCLLLCHQHWHCQMGLLYALVHDAAQHAYELLRCTALSAATQVQLVCTALSPMLLVYVWPTAQIKGCQARRAVDPIEYIKSNISA